MYHKNRFFVFNVDPLVVATADVPLSLRAILGPNGGLPWQLTISDKVPRGKFNLGKGKPNKPLFIFYHEESEKLSPNGRLF
jgi:hypothetical protein